MASRYRVARTPAIQLKETGPDRPDDVGRHMDQARRHEYRGGDAGARGEAAAQGRSSTATAKAGKFS